MNMGNVEHYAISSEYNISEIISHFGPDYAMQVLEDKLENINYASSLIEPNLAAAFETNFKLLEENNPEDSLNIRVIRAEIYDRLIETLTKRFNLSFNKVDDTIDLYVASYYLYDFLVCNRNNIMVSFFTSFIVNNKDSLYAALNIDDFKKNKDTSTAYSKRIYPDSKYAAISANINKVINYITNLDITLVNIFQSTYQPEVVLMLDNAFGDIGNFFRDHYCTAINNIELAPVIMTNIRLQLQKLVGDTSTSHINELLANE